MRAIDSQHKISPTWVILEKNLPVPKIFRAPKITEIALFLAHPVVKICKLLDIRYKLRMASHYLKPIILLMVTALYLFWLGNATQLKLNDVICCNGNQSCFTNCITAPSYCDGKTFNFFIIILILFKDIAVDFLHPAIKSVCVLAARLANK